MREEGSVSTLTQFISNAALTARGIRKMRKILRTVNYKGENFLIMCKYFNWL